MLLLNGGFEDWNGGTSFPSPAAETADDWFAVGPTGSTTVSRNSTTVYAGTYSLQVADGGNPHEIHLSQTVAGHAALAGKTLFCAIRVRAVSGGQNPYTLSVDDGVNITTDSAAPGTGGWTRLVVTHTMDASPTTLKVAIGCTSTNGVMVIDDAVLLAPLEQSLTDTVTMSDSIFSILNQLFRLTLTDAMALVEEFDPPKFNIKGFTEVVRIQDWLRKRRRIAQNRWTN